MSARRLGLLWLGLAAAPAAAQMVVTSPRPDRVAVTVYRDLTRDTRDPFNLRWLQGYALITETRQVALPAGETELRFEGVAGLGDRMVHRPGRRLVSGRLHDRVSALA